MEIMVLILLKTVFTQDFAGKLPGIFPILRLLVEKETGIQYIDIVYRYVLSTVYPVSSVNPI